LESPVNAHLIEALTHTKNLQRAWCLVDKTITVIIELITELPAIYIPSDRSVVRVLEDTRRRTDHPTPSTYTTLIISGRPFIDHSIPVIVLFITDLYRCGDTFTSSEFSPQLCADRRAQKHRELHRTHSYLARYTGSGYREEIHQ
jgi:hypothetical protein